MVEYEMVAIIPKLKSEIKQSGKRSWFHIIDDTDRRFTCFNQYLYEAVEIGERIQAEIAKGKRSVIVDIVGFKPDYPPHGSRVPINESERAFFDLMKNAGWELTKRGWPDFACFKDGKLILIEVKPKRSHRLKFWQTKLMMELVKHDIKCYRWSPDGGFEPVTSYIKFPVDLP